MEFHKPARPGSINPDLAYDICQTIARGSILRVPKSGNPDFIPAPGMQQFPHDKLPDVDREYVEYMKKLGYLRQLTENRESYWSGWREMGLDGTDCELYVLSQ